MGAVSEICETLVFFPRVHVIHAVLLFVRLIIIHLNNGSSKVVVYMLRAKNKILLRSTNLNGKNVKIIVIIFSINAVILYNKNII